MSLNARIITYSIFFAIVILFLGLAYTSISKIKSAKLDPETFYTSKLIDTGFSIVRSSDELYKFIDISSKINPMAEVSIADEYDNQVVLTKHDISKDKIEAIAENLYKQKSTIEDIEEEESMQRFVDSFELYYQAIDLLTEVCEEILYDFENENCQQCLIPAREDMLARLGKDNFRIRYYIDNARKKMKK